MSETIGFISTRFAGTDGVSLESAKWAQVLWDHNYVSFWYAGRLDRAADISLCVPEAHFNHPENQWINERIWGTTRRDPDVSRRIHALADYLKKTLYDFVNRFDLSLLAIENAVTIPMHVPLGLALTEFLAETGIPSIGHHHDFYWERTRFSVNAVPDFLDVAFPPRDPEMTHVVINQTAQEQLSLRKGVPSTLIPNVLDFENVPREPDTYAADVRSEIGLKPDDIMILQPTRVVPRKGIEHSIKLVQMLEDPRYKLVISHEAGDEGPEYWHMIQELACESRVDLRLVSTRIGDVRQLDEAGRKIYTLWDLYPHADLVTYPSLYEGFGNAFLEAIYFRLPLLINRYAIFVRDIEPKGFRFLVMDGFLTRRTAEEVRQVLEDADFRREITDHNLRLATRFYSYSVLRRKLYSMLANIRGEFGS
jgi:glycosyltransferase involved in cell wall biosynthesis